MFYFRSWNAPPTAAAPAADIDARDIAMLHELAEIGLRLARQVAEFTEGRIKEAKESGWDGNVPHDPSAAFSRLAQSVRRSLALKARLREGGGIGRRSNGGDGGDSLFASFGRPIRLDPDFAPISTPEPAANSLVAEAHAREERGETIAADLGPLLDPRERLLWAGFGPISGHAGEIMASLGIDPARVA